MFVLLQVDYLLKDVLEVLSLVRSTKNNFAPINRIPGAILSLIPRYWERLDPDFDKSLVALTHVCRAWRALFTAYPSLWNRLDLMDVSKTSAYIKRSRSLPLEVVICESKYKPYLEGAFLSAVPDFRRLQSFTFIGIPDLLRDISKHQTPTTPLLKELTIDVTEDPAPTIGKRFFSGDLSSLRVLQLTRVITRLPWNHLPNLTTFKLSHVPDGGITVVQLLNFFESAPHLRDVTLNRSIPAKSNALSGRVVYLSHLKNLTIAGEAVHSTLLNHLSIPEGALLVMDFDFNSDESPLPHYLPKTTRNLKNLFRITTVNLHFNETMKFVRLDGPSGGLYLSGHRKDWAKATPSPDLDPRILLSLNYFSLHMTRRLAIMKYEPPTQTEVNESSYRFLLRMPELRALTLTQCNNLPFILALDPAYNQSDLVLCSKLEELTLYVEDRNAFHIPELASMAKQRASKGAKLRSIAIVGLDQLVSGKEVFKLRDHVGHVEYRFEEVPPKWDSVPEGESG